MRQGISVLGLIGLLSGCVTTSAPPVTSPVSGSVSGATSVPTGQVSRGAFNTVLSRVEPVAEQVCRERTRNTNCDFKIVIEADPQAPINAWQSVDETGRPVLTFTQSLIADLGNTDELAFIVGHEAAHHISGHLAETRQTAITGAILGGVLVAAIGGDAAAIERAQNVGATVGARRFSKDHELEADQLGTIIAHFAGYDPVRGAAYFTRISDPGDQFLGTHPPNAQRIEIVRKTAAGL